MRIGNLYLRASAAHLDEALHPSHSPVKWSWWKMFSIRLVRLAVYVEAYIDRRDHQ